MDLLVAYVMYENTKYDNVVPKCLSTLDSVSKKVYNTFLRYYKLNVLMLLKQS